jgi:hypothetical protein
MERMIYPSDLSDGQWTVIASVLSCFQSKAGRPPKFARREIWNAIFYQARTGCERPSSTAKLSRRRKGGANGYDAGMKSKGRKRHCQIRKG